MGDNYIYAAALADLPQEGCRVVRVHGQVLALFRHQGQVYALDNRCPHMGFPLDRGTVDDGILTCHWHHARFDLATGGTFDLFADDVPSFPVEVRDNAVWVDLTPRDDAQLHQLQRLHEGMEHQVPLVIAKAILARHAAARQHGLEQTFASGLAFGARYRRAGWGQGLTMLTCFANLLPHLDAEDRPLALYHGLSAVAANTEDSPPRFPLAPLPGAAPDFSTLKRWFRRFVEVRDGEGAERCIVTAVRAGADARAMADLLFTAATDHRYLQIGHVADFTNKALEALDLVGWDEAQAELVLSSLADGYMVASRQEEANAWRNPIDLVELLQAAFDGLPKALEVGARRGEPWRGREALPQILLGDNPQAIADALLEALREGASGEQLAGTVAYAAGLRIARFHTSNEFGDWDTALHTFTFANAMHQAILRVANSKVDILRGVFDAAMSIYLDRFLNIPAARLPAHERTTTAAATILAEFPTLLDRQQQVNEAGKLVAEFLSTGGEPAQLLAMLGKLLLREDRDFHTIQTIEAAFRQYQLLGPHREGMHVLIATARYLAAHAPSVRAQGQTYQIAQRLHRGEKIYEEES